ncbi:c-Myc-binding protein isoform X2 [Halyomorpha halys]|uniref:c-Myc-binding protein isoform X2 n=1 Tax=Halyomorpha halys TaxID=286706 RepID=UPI0006D4D883|nr:uncharacterized protein LOC106690063 isoform X2 [Halyomorpha halys]
MTTTQEKDEKLHEFWQYIDKCKVMESLTEAFTDLCNEPEKPRDVLEYLKDRLGDNHPPEGTPEALRKLLREARVHIKELEEEIRIVREEKKNREKKMDMYKQKKKEMSWKDASLCADKIGLRLMAEKNDCTKPKSMVVQEESRTSKPYSIKSILSEE